MESFGAQPRRIIVGWSQEFFELLLQSVEPSLGRELQVVLESHFQIFR